MFEVFPLCRQVLVAPCVVKFQCSTSNIKGDTATFYFLHLTSHFHHVIVYFTHFGCSAAIFDNIDTAQTMTVHLIFSYFHLHDHVAVMFQVFPLCRHVFEVPCVVKF